MLSYVPNHSKHSKTTKVIKLRWIAWIWRQNEQKCWVTSRTIRNTAKLQKWSNYDELDRFDVKTIKKFWVTSQTIPNTAKLQSDQITMNCIDLTSKRSIMLSYVPNHSKYSKTTKVIKIQWIASIWCQNYKKCWVTSQTIPNTAKLQSDQITMNCIDLTSKRSIMLSYVPNHSKYSKTTKVIKIQWIASIWCQNDKNVELRPKSFETQQNYKSDQITMNCIDLM